MNHLVEEIILKNGSRGLFVHVPGATVMSSQFHFRAGDQFVKRQDIYETAHIMEHMSFGANADYKDGQRYEADFTRNGAYHNAFTSDTGMTYVSECADFEWDRILELKRVAIVQPRFNEEELKAESGNVRSELTGYLNNYASLLWPKLAQKMGEKILTNPERIALISNVSLADIREHHKRTHTSDNMRFVITGNIEGRKGKLIDMLEAWDLPRGERLSIPVDELHRTDSVMIRRKESSNVTFGLSFVIPRRLSDSEFDAMSMINHILSGTLHSTILGAARKKGLAYHMFSDTTIYEHNSSWDFGSQITEASLDPFFDILIRETGRVLGGDIDQSALADAKSYALGKYQMSMQTVGQINSWYAGRYFFDGVIVNYKDIPEKIDAVTTERIVATARDIMSANCWGMGFVGTLDKSEGERIREQVARLLEL